MTFLEVQTAKLFEFKNLAQKTEVEITELRTKFNELEQAKVEIQKVHTEVAVKLNSYLQSIHVLEGVLKDLEAENPAPVTPDPVIPTREAEIPYAEVIEEPTA